MVSGTISPSPIMVPDTIFPLTPFSPDTIFPRGFSLSGVAQAGPFIGGQGIWNNSGVLFGPSFGTPGFSLTAGYSWCWDY
jgi:hypothetical protein